MYREKLIALMEYKAKIIHEESGFDKSKYFNDQDKEDILSWSEKEAMEIWFEILRVLRFDDADATTVCPFCLKYTYKNLDCSSCGYGKRHGICDRDANNDYAEIICNTKKPMVQMAKEFVHNELRK